VLEFATNQTDFVRRYAQACVDEVEKSSPAQTIAISSSALVVESCGEGRGNILRFLDRRVVVGSTGGMPLQVLKWPNLRFPAGIGQHDGPLRAMQLSRRAFASAGELVPASFLVSQFSIFAIMNMTESESPLGLQIELSSEFSHSTTFGVGIIRQRIPGHQLRHRNSRSGSGEHGEGISQLALGQLPWPIRLD
jgi:hypothetical protein